MKRYWPILLGLTLMLTGCSGSVAATSSKVPTKEASLTANPSATGTLSPTATATHVPITPAALGTHLPKAGAMISSENANQLGLLARWGNGNSKSAQYTPDGQYLVVAYSTGLYFYNASDFSFAKFVDLHTAIFDLVISPNGKTMVATSLDKAFIIENDISVFFIKTNVISMAFSPDSQTLALGVHQGNNDNIQLWDVGNQKMIREFSSGGDWVSAVVFSPDGKFLASGNNFTQIWNLDGTVVDRHGPYVSGGGTFDLSFSPDGSLLAEAGYTSTNIIHVWRVLENGRLVIYRNLVPRDRYASSRTVSFSPNGKYLAIGMSDGTYLWDINLGVIIRKLSTDDGKVGWSPDSKFLVVPGETGMQVFESRDGLPIKTFNVLTGPIQTLAWSPTGNQIARGTVDGGIALFGAQTGDLIATYGGDSLRNHFAFSPDGKFFAFKGGSHNDGGNVKIIHLQDNNFQQILKDSYGTGMTGESFSDDGAYLVTSGFIDGIDAIQIWKTSNWSLYRSWKVPDGLINGLILSPDGQTVALSYSDHDSILLFHSADGSKMQELAFTSPVGRSFVYGASFSPDGQTLLSVSSAYFSKQEERHRLVLKLWRVSTGEQVYSIDDTPGRKISAPLFEDARDRLNSIAWSPSGECFAIGMSDGSIQVYRASDGELIQTLAGHILRATAVAFSPDGHYLASGSLDGTIRIWGVLP